MFARFRLPDGETNVNVTLVRDFEPGTTEGTSKLNFLGGDSMVVPVSNRAVRNAFKKALATSQKDEQDDAPEAPTTGEAEG